MQNPFVQMTETERAERRARFFAEEAAAGPEPTGALAWTSRLWRDAQRLSGGASAVTKHIQVRIAGDDEANAAERKRKLARALDRVNAASRQRRASAPVGANRQAQEAS